jgi:hypothetical protein
MLWCVKSLQNHFSRAEEMLGTKVGGHLVGQQNFRFSVAMRRHILGW